MQTLSRISIIFCGPFTEICAIVLLSPVIMFVNGHYVQVIAMKRPSPQSVVFDWFVGLCGLEQDVGGLLALLATPTLSHSGPLLHAPVDEEAPVSCLGNR